MAFLRFQEKIAVNQHGQLQTVGVFALAAIGLSGIAGAMAALVLYTAPQLAPLLLPGLIGVIPVVALGLARFHALVFLGIASLGVVRWEPAPVDMLLPLLLVLGLLAGRLSLRELQNASIIHASLWVFVAINLASLLVARDLVYSIRYLVITFYLMGLAYFVRLYITSQERMRLVLFGYVVAALLSVFLVGLELFGLSPTSEFFIREQRALALFKDANVFAPFLILPILFLFDELLRPHLIPGRSWLKIGAMLALCAGVFLAFSRAGWANLLVALMAYLAMSARSLSWWQWARLILLTLVGLVVLAVLVVQLNLLSFLLWRATPLQSYDSDRFGTQMVGIEAGLSHLFGIGPGMLFDAHSLYVRTFAEYGVFGFVALFIALLVPLFYCFRRARSASDRVHGLSARVVTACMVGLLLNGLVIDLIHWRSFWVLFALCWIVAAVQSYEERQKR